MKTQITIENDVATFEDGTTVAVREIIAAMRALPELLSIVQHIDNAFAGWSNDKSDELTMGEWLDREDVDELTVADALNQADRPSLWRKQHTGRDGTDNRLNGI